MARVDTSIVPRAVSRLKDLTSPTGVFVPRMSNFMIAFFAASALMIYAASAARVSSPVPWKLKDTPTASFGSTGYTHGRVAGSGELRLPHADAERLYRDRADGPCPSLCHEVGLGRIGRVVEALKASAPPSLPHQVFFSSPWRV